MMFLCPHCGSTHIRTINYGKKIGCILGLLAGAFAGITGIPDSFSPHHQIEPFSVIPSHDITTLILRSIAGATSGCIAGITLGELIDENILSNYRCEECQSSFNITHH